MILKTLITFSLITQLGIVKAAEVDHYTLSKVEIPNSSQLIHQKLQHYLQLAIKEANILGPCDQDTLYEKMRQYFNNHSKGKLTQEIIFDKNFPNKKIKLEDSVFKEWSVFNGFLLGRNKAKKSPLALGPIMRIDKHVIGTDKLEHFFGSGFRYFKRHHIKGKNLLSVLKRGVFLEKTILGGNFLATGVFSYADLSANFNGMRFWNHVLQKDDDVLGASHNLGPYVSCEHAQWVQVKEIHLEDYLDESFDESRNCSKFATPRGLEKYTTQVGAIENKQNREFQCLSYSENNSLLTDKYHTILKNGDPIHHWIINQNGHEQVSYFNEF